MTTEEIKIQADAEIELYVSKLSRGDLFDKRDRLIAELFFCKGVRSQTNPPKEVAK